MDFKEKNHKMSFVTLTGPQGMLCWVMMLQVPLLPLDSLVSTHTNSLRTLTMMFKGQSNFLLLNPLSPKSDKHLISPYSIIT